MKDNSTSSCEMTIISKINRDSQKGLDPVGENKRKQQNKSQ